MFNIFKNIRGLTGTILFHIGLVALLYFLGFSTPLPLPEEQGIVVNFGTSAEGMGTIEPSINNTPENIPEQTKSSEKIPDQSNEGYLTQDIEDAPAVKSSKKTSDNELEKKKLEEIQRKKELERKKKEEAERKRKEAEEKKRKQQEIDQMVTNAFTKGKNTTDNSSTSEGIKKGDGNQGKEEGIMNSNNYLISGLGGRNPLRLPEPAYDYQVEGKVVVEVTVDKNGRVTKAYAGKKGTTIMNVNLYKAAEEAALKARFDSQLDGPEFQKGTITYYFKLR